MIGRLGLPMIYADTTVNWTPKKLAEWVKEREDGLQYRTPHGDAYCPKRWWEND